MSSDSCVRAPRRGRPRRRVPHGAVPLCKHEAAQHQACLCAQPPAAGCAQGRVLCIGCDDRDPGAWGDTGAAHARIFPLGDSMGPVAISRAPTTDRPGCSCWRRRFRWGRQLFWSRQASWFSPALPAGLADSYWPSLPTQCLRTHLTILRRRQHVRASASDCKMSAHPWSNDQENHAQQRSLFVPCCRPLTDFRD